MANTGSFKVGVVGCGRVGMTAAFAMMLSGTPAEIVLTDRSEEKVEGEKLDLEHALPFLDYVKITAGSDYSLLSDCRFIVYTAGVAQKPGETRLDLYRANKAILTENLPKIVAAAPGAVILLVANPVDLLTYEAHQIVPTAGGKIFGSGTMLDTARFRWHLGEVLKVNPHSIHTYILGEHGESAFPVYDNALIGGQKLVEFPGATEAVIREAYEKTRQAAGKIIEAKGATYYAIGVVVTKIMEAVSSDAKTVFPLSVSLSNYYGHTGMALSVPCVVGANGVERILEVDLSEREKADLAKSVAVLAEYLK